MSFLRRAAIVSVMAAAVAVGGAAASASAAPSSPSAITVDGPGDGNGYGHGHGRPIRFGPFEIPSDGNVSAGFQWGTSNGGGLGF